MKWIIAEFPKIEKQKYHCQILRGLKNSWHFKAEATQTERLLRKERDRLPWYESSKVFDGRGQFFNNLAALLEAGFPFTYFCFLASPVRRLPLLCWL